MGHPPLHSVDETLKYKLCHFTPPAFCEVVLLIRSSRPTRQQRILPLDSTTISLPSGDLSRKNKKRTIQTVYIVYFRFSITCCSDSSPVKRSGVGSLESSSGVTSPDTPTCDGEVGALLQTARETVGEYFNDHQLQRLTINALKSIYAAH